MKRTGLLDRLGPLGLLGVVGVCCGGHLLALGTAAVGAGLLALLAR